MILCFVASGNSVHSSARQLLGAIKQTKNRVLLLLATSQCRLALSEDERRNETFYCTGEQS